MMKFNLEKLNKVEGRKQYLGDISNRFATLANLDAEVDIREIRKLSERISTFQPKEV
jgi:hypothetical protein